jgi:hypothetical protein
MSFNEAMLPKHLTDIVTSFTDWAYREIEVHCRADTVKSSIFHYTTQVGLEGILGSGAIRLTHLAKVFGDDQEFLYARSLANDALRLSYDEAVAALARNETASFDAQRFFCEGTLSMLKKITPTTGPFEFYSASFCRRGDDDFLWNKYAADGAGFALGLSPVLFADPSEGTILGVMDKIFGNYIFNNTIQLSVY